MVTGTPENDTINPFFSFIYIYLVRTMILLFLFLLGNLDPLMFPLYSLMLEYFQDLFTSI